MAQRQWRSDDTSKWKYKFGDGSDGDLTISGNTTFSAPNESCSGTGGTTSLTVGVASFANGELVLIHQSRGTGVGNWELNKISSGGGTTSLTMESNLINTYTDSGASQAQIVKLLQYSSVTVNTGINWTAPTWDENKGGIIAYLCNGDTTITGNIVGSSIGFIYGIQVQGSPATAYCGEGIHGASTQDNDPSGNAGGGGVQTSGLSAGGGGGNGTAGGLGRSKGDFGGAGGDAAGTASLVTLVLGGGGGGGTRDNNVSGRGGKGGASVFIFSSTLSISGTISLTGEDGESAAATGGGGGGGAGGSCLLKCVTATLGTTLITAPGGTGGIGFNLDSEDKNGGDGGVGRIHLDYSGSYTGTTTPTIDTTLDSTISTGGTGNFFLVM